MRQVSTPPLCSRLGCLGPCKPAESEWGRTVAVRRVFPCPWCCWGRWCRGLWAVTQTGPGVCSQPCLVSGTVLCLPGWQRLRAAPGPGAQWGPASDPPLTPGKTGLKPNRCCRASFSARVCVCVSVHAGVEYWVSKARRAQLGSPPAGSGFVFLSRELDGGDVPSAEASALLKSYAVYPGRKCTTS